MENAPVATNVIETDYEEPHPEGFHISQPFYQVLQTKVNKLCRAFNNHRFDFFSPNDATPTAFLDSALHHLWNDEANLANEPNERFLTRCLIQWVSETQNKLITRQPNQPLPKLIAPAVKGLYRNYRNDPDVMIGMGFYSLLKENIPRRFL